MSERPETRCERVHVDPDSQHLLDIIENLRDLLAKSEAKWFDTEARWAKDREQSTTMREALERIAADHRTFDSAAADLRGNHCLDLMRIANDTLASLSPPSTNEEGDGE